MEKTKGSGKEGPSVGVRVSTNLEEGGRVSPWECGWEEEARLLTKGKEGDGVKAEPEVSRIMCLEAATAENKALRTPCRGGGGDGAGRLLQEGVGPRSPGISAELP